MFVIVDRTPYTYDNAEVGDSIYDIPIPHTYTLMMHIIYVYFIINDAYAYLF